MLFWMEDRLACHDIASRLENRDLGVLALRVHGSRYGGTSPANRRETDTKTGGRMERPLSVLDALCGSGIRALRYIEEGKATSVLANDANGEMESEREANLRRHIASGTVSVTTGDCMDAYFSARLERRYFDMVDAGTFSHFFSTSSCIRH